MPMKTFTRILLLCLFPVLATGCEKKVNITYEHRYWDEYKFINASSKEVYCLYGSSHIVNNREKENRDGFIVPKGNSHSLFLFAYDGESPFLLINGDESNFDWIIIHNNERYVEYTFQKDGYSPYFDRFYDSTYTDNNVTFHVYTIKDDLFKNGKPIEELQEWLINNQ